MAQKGSNRRWTDEEIQLLEEKFSTTRSAKIADEIGRTEMAVKHKARRLGLEKEENYRVKRLLKEYETPEFKNDEFANFICGFVAGEGTFTANSSAGRESGKRYTFQIQMSEVDEEILHKIKNFFGVGNVYHFESREENWADTVQYQVQAIGALANVIIPFFEQYSLCSTHKQKQFNEWKESFYEQYDIDRNI